MLTPSYLLLLGLLLAVPDARAAEGEVDCRRAYSPEYAALWRLSETDWITACAASKRSKDILRDAQRAFIDACMRRFPPRAGFTIFDIQIACARGTVGEAQLAPAVVEDQKADVPTAPLPGAGSKKYLLAALTLARELRPDACFAGLTACFNCDSAGASKKFDYWEYEFYSSSAKDRGIAVKFDLEGNPTVKRDGNAVPGCIRDMTVSGAEAITIARQNGLEDGDGLWTELKLRIVTDTRRGVNVSDIEVFKRFPRLRGKTVWHVFSMGKHVLIDPRTGKVVGRF